MQVEGRCWNFFFDLPVIIITMIIFHHSDLVVVFCIILISHSWL